MPSIELKLTKEPRKYNQTLRISGAKTITPAVLEEAARICQQNSEGEDAEDSATWRHMYRNIRDVLDGNLCPEEGTPVLGPFLMDYVTFPEKGNKVTIAKEALVHSTHPDFDQAGKIAARKQTVTVHQVHGGFIDHDRGVRVVDPEVKWAGASTYWKWTSLANVEVDA